MGNVSVQIPPDCCLEQFTAQWETYFFGSFFSHSLQGGSPVKGNVVQLWQQLTSAAQPFPTDRLLTCNFQLKHLIS